MKSKNLPGGQVVCYPCPLSSKIPTHNNPLARRCTEIIGSARRIWGHLPPEEQSVYYEIVNGEEVQKKFPPYSNFKLTSARSIQSWYVEYSNLILTNPKTPEAIKKAVQDVRWFARPSIESSTTDKEILAIFAICEAFDAIHSIQQGKPEEAIREKVLSASTFLKLAKMGIESEKQDISQVQLDEPITNDTIFFDRDNRYLWLDINKKERLEPEDSRVLEVIINTLKNRPFCRIEEIILLAYQKEISCNAKLRNISEYNRCKSVISTANSRYRKLLGINDKKIMLIQSEDDRIIKLSKPVVLREVLRKSP